jgi:pimeloyl-ACP methyl ester carboxylesterase
MPLAKTSHGSIWYADHRRDHFSYPPLLLIHGAAGTHLDWSLALRRLNAIVPDLPGHGKSNTMPSRNRIEEYAADMIALLDALEITQAVIVGQSMGGAIVQMMALQAVERISGLVLISTGARLPVSSRILDNLLTNQQLVGEWLKQWLWAKTTPQHLRQLGFQQFMQTTPQVALDDYNACQHFDIRDRLGDIHTQVLIFGASEDQMTPIAASLELKAGLRDAELVTVENAGHMMQLEQPELIVNKMTQWLTAKVDSTRKPRHSS